MPRESATRSPERKEIKVRYNFGQSPNTVGRELKRSRVGVIHVLKCEEDAQRPKIESRGRKKALTEREKRHIGYYLSRHVNATAVLKLISTYRPIYLQSPVFLM